MAVSIYSIHTHAMLQLEVNWNDACTLVKAQEAGGWGQIDSCSPAADAILSVNTGGTGTITGTEQVLMAIMGWFKCAM
jgi:hypothetical protein